MMRLPNGERADLEVKLEEYVLNPLHRDGRQKARVFESALGITHADPSILRRAILAAAAGSDQAETRGDNGHGAVYVLRFPLSTVKGSAVVLTAWIVRHGEDFRRLTTCSIVQTMSDRLPLHAVVALLEDTRTTHFESGAPLLLRRGDTGTVVMTYDDGACEVEFADRSGCAYAMLALPVDRLLVLHDTPERAGV